MDKKILMDTLSGQNLLKAFAGESQAAARYRLFAHVARKEGYETIARFFEETVHNELRHGRIFFELMQGGMLEITASYPAGRIGTTLENLKAAAEGEYDEWSNLYPEYSKVAEDEGYTDVALRFMQIASIEKTHEERFSGLYKSLEAQQLYVKESDTVWRCMECGHIYIGKQAPKQCPVCGEQGIYEIRCDSY